MGGPQPKDQAPAVWERATAELTLCSDDELERAIMILCRERIRRRARAEAPPLIGPEGVQ